MDLQPERARRCLRVFDRRLGNERIGRIHQHGDRGDLGTSSCSNSSRFGASSTKKLLRR